MFSGRFIGTGLQLGERGFAWVEAASTASSQPEKPLTRLGISTLSNTGLKSGAIERVNCGL